MVAFPSFNIFRPGTFTSMEGRTVTLSANDLARTAAAYNRRAQQAPIVLGHPLLDEPAEGWIGRLDFDGRFLKATPARVLASFAEKVRKKLFMRVSASFHAPGAADNPDPGAWSLRHVGFLGAAAPAVRGLGIVAFAEPGMPEIGVAAPQLALDAVSFATPPGYVLSEEGESLYRRALAIREANPAMSLIEAASAAERNDRRRS